MAILAVPLLEAAAEGVLYLLGATAVAGGAVIVADEVKKRQRASDDASATPVVKAAPDTDTRRKCDKCPPDCGMLITLNRGMSDDARAYQARITGFAPGTEWAYGGRDFDGFKSAECHLLEAKAKYDQFLRVDFSGKLKPVYWFTYFRDEMIPQARAQSKIAAASPPARLTWYFKTPMTYEYVGAIIGDFFPLVPVYQP